MDGWGRVSGAVINRRAALGLTQRQLAQKAGVSERTVQSLEAGSRPQPLSRGKIEKALGWETGEMLRIAEREPEPDLMPPGLRERIRDILPPDRAARVEAAVEAALRDEPPPGAPGAARPREGRAEAG